MTAAAASTPPSAPEKMAWWQKTLLGLAVVVAWIVVGTFAAKFFVGTTTLTEPVDRQLAALKRGDIEAACAEMTAEYRGRTPLAAFRDGIASVSQLSRGVTLSFHERTVGTRGARLRGTLVDDRGDVLLLHYLLVEEDGMWRIRSFDATPAPKPKD